MTPALRALIVDDVKLARQRLRRLLGAHPDVEVVGECADAASAIAAIAEHTPDLVFLDIEMPEQDGFAVLAELPAVRRPAIVFVTAYDQHAVKAFEANALDYLLKPVEPARMAATLERVRGQRTTGGSDARLDALLRVLERDRYPVRLAVRGTDGTQLVRVAEIDWIEAAGNYLCVRAGKQTHVLRETLTQMEAKLDPARFVRIHRSRIVNIDRIARLSPLFNGDHCVLLGDGTELTLSRTYREALFRVIGEPR
jgi:two-component system LytT family response regulator